MLVKSGDAIARLEAPFTDADIAKYLVHEDGFLRVPVLVLGDVLVRGYTDALYREALGG
jgi:arsenate reductase-like glutaredoxin family protein